LCALLLPLVIFAAFNMPWGQTADMWETAAAIRAAAQNVLHPSNPLLPLPGSTSPRFTPFVIFWGAFARLSGLGLFTVVGLAGVANFLLFVTGLARWITGQFKEPKLAIFVLICMLAVWGEGYSYANAYHFGFFLSTLAYVGTFTYGVCFHALAFLRTYMDTPKAWGSLIAYALLGTLAFVTHPITGAFLFVAAAAMLLPEKSLFYTARLQLVPLVAFGLTLLWPYFNYWDTLTKGSTDNWFPHALFTGQIPALGTALLGLIILFYYYRRRRYLSVVLGGLFCFALYGLCGAARIFIGNRFLLYGTIFLHIAIALYLFENWPRWWREISFRQPRTLTKLAVVVLLFLPAMRFRAGETYHLGQDMAHAAFGSYHHETTAERFCFLSTQLGDTNVVLTEDDTGWPVPAICGARLVSQQKGDPLIQQEIVRRRKDAESFFKDPLSIDERRDMLKRYKVSHVLLDLWHQDTWDNMLFAQLTQIAREQMVQDKVVLYRVLP
jgi:hypothetical protein